MQVADGCPRRVLRPRKITNCGSSKQGKCGSVGTNAPGSADTRRTFFLLDQVAPTFFAFLTLHHLSLPPSGAFSLICSKMQAQSAVLLHVTMCNYIQLFFNIKNVNVSYSHKRIRFSVLYSFAPFILVGSLLLITEPRKNHSLLFFPIF